MLSQNVDGLSERADHPTESLLRLHGSLFRVQCTDAQSCGYSREDFADPIVPALAMNEGSQIDGLSSPAVRPESLPTCPDCHRLLRPGVVWFGEMLPKDVLARVSEVVTRASTIDLMLVIGTAAQVYPAAGYIDVARAKGARICVVNADANDRLNESWREGDWFFQGDAAEIVPKLLEPVIEAENEGKSG